MSDWYVKFAKKKVADSNKIIHYNVSYPDWPVTCEPASLSVNWCLQ